MYSDLKNLVEKTVNGIIENPAHIIAWEERENELKKTPGLYEKHRRLYSEDFVFAVGEDIMVYVDFPLRGAKFKDEEEMRSFAESYAHRHEFFEMFYVYRGTCYCYFNGEKYALSAGSAWIFNTRCRHSVIVPDDGSVLINIMARKSTFSSKIQAVLQDNDIFLDFFLDSVYSQAGQASCMRFNIPEGSMAEFYIFSIIREYSLSQRYCQSMLRLMFSSLLVGLSRLYMENPLPKNDSRRTELARIISYISDNYAAVTLKSLADEFHLSQSYLSKLIYEYTGQAFSSYILNYRMEKAKELLCSTQLPIDGVAAAVGYVQRSSFEKKFKQHFGITPAKYRTGTAKKF